MKKNKFTLLVVFWLCCFPCALRADYSRVIDSFLQTENSRFIFNYLASDPQPAELKKFTETLFRSLEGDRLVEEVFQQYQKKKKYYFIIKNIFQNTNIQFERSRYSEYFLNALEKVNNYDMLARELIKLFYKRASNIEKYFSYCDVIISEDKAAFLFNALQENKDRFQNAGEVKILKSYFYLKSGKMIQANKILTDLNFKAVTGHSFPLAVFTKENINTFLTLFYKKAYYAEFIKLYNKLERVYSNRFTERNMRRYERTHLLTHALSGITVNINNYIYGKKLFINNKYQQIITNDKLSDFDYYYISALVLNKKHLLEKSADYYRQYLQDVFFNNTNQLHKSLKEHSTREAQPRLMDRLVLFSENITNWRFFLELERYKLSCSTNLVSFYKTRPVLQPSLEDYCIITILEYYFNSAAKKKFLQFYRNHYVDIQAEHNREKAMYLYGSIFRYSDYDKAGEIFKKILFKNQDSIYKPFINLFFLRHDT
ncbi:MAG TPA: hypothetical protein VKS21_04850 [Spirochaetota bacterium]|nr:hypothetical protein [Spirochaetota bacterium]